MSSLFGTAALAVPRIPADDTVVVEHLPAVTGWSEQERRLRRELTASPRDPRIAVTAARSYLELARSQGDARYAGYAMGALKAWDAVSPADTPVSVLVMHATVAQFLHDFDGAEATLKLALARKADDPQAWITMATILRVRGRYAESDAACHSLEQIAPPMYASACLAENAGLRGNTAATRTTLQRLLADPSLAGDRGASTRQWLLTTLGEVEELSGRVTSAESAYRQALAAESSDYLLLALSDFLIAQNRAAEVPALLASEPRADAVILRLAIARAKSTPQPVANPDADELRARFAAAALRPGTTQLHAREEGLFALDVDGDAPHALQLARADVDLQREPVDLLLFARAAAAAHDSGALAEARALMKLIGLKDARVDAIH